ncbi:hypothetical protein [Aeromicrobium sp.]|uniref:hypothetical protein n=1 Tax=Aeromicrobium sp. TaxID=1871063 RepID=UPI002FCBA1A2
MDKFVRTGIVTLAGTVALGTAGLAIASANDNDAPVKREDTSVPWMQDTDDNDDLTPDDDTATGASTPSRASVRSVASAPSKVSARSAASAPSKVSARSVASASSKASAQSAASAPSNDSASSGNSN